jgi:hypothetical protein
MSQEEKLTARAHNNSRQYLRFKAQIEDLEVRLRALVQVGRMTQEQANEVLVSRLPGHYRAKKKLEIAQARIGAEETREEGDTERGVLARVFDGAEVAGEGFMERRMVTWPTTAGVQQFWEIYFMCVPIGLWPVTFPNITPAWELTKSYVPTSADHIFLILMHSRNLCLSFLGESPDTADTPPAGPLVMERVTSPTSERDKGMRRTRMQEVYLEGMTRVQRALIPRTDSLSFYVIAEMVDEAGRQQRGG